jgi:O-antigen biosynthesis protein WbqP
MLKRATDIVLASTALLLFSPAFLLAAVAIKLDSPGPVIFKQKRIGRYGELFEIYKFRTMHQDTPQVATELMLKLERSPITKVGAFLRKFSVDELPQIFNVLSGHMSLVGPRPALYNQYELTRMRTEAGVLRFPPGVTGWAQVNGRDELSDEVKVEHDRWYCDNWGYWLDWRILVMTVATIFNRRGAI